MRVILNWINAHQNALALVIVCSVVAIMYFWGEKNKKIVWFGTIIYVFFIMFKTVFSRAEGIATINLELGWSYKAVFNGTPGMLSQIYLNIMLFVPLGCMIYQSKPQKLRRILMKGFLLSLCIELCQLVFKRGMFEWDDIINNSLGCLIGGVCGNVVQSVRRINQLHKSHGRE